MAIASEKKLKSELAKLKSLTSNGQLVNPHIVRDQYDPCAMLSTQWQAKYDLNEQELLKAKDKENSLLADLGRLETEVSDTNN